MRVFGLSGIEGKNMKFKKCINLFLTMFKIGLFTFGGGYAMIPLIESELVSRKKWLGEDEFTDMLAIAESTPGPIAINSATYAGYKIAGFWGSFFATLGVVLPSLIIIFVISLFFDKFLEIQWVSNAFKGIRACVVFLILSAGIKMLLHMPKTVFNMIVFPIVLVCVAAFSLTSVNFSTIFYILLGAFASVIVYLCTNAKNRTKTGDNAKTATADAAIAGKTAKNGTEETINNDVQKIETATENTEKETENADKESK